MSEMYGRIEELCKSNGISIGKMCTELGVSRGTMGDLNAGRTKKLSADNVSKIAAYFSVSTDFILTGAQKENAPADRGEDVSDDDIKFALFGGDGEITDEMYNEVKNFAQYVKQRERSKGE